MGQQSGIAQPMMMQSGVSTQDGMSIQGSTMLPQCAWLGNAPNTPMGQLPTMNTPLATTCAQSGGTLQPVAVYTDAQNYYTAGYKCCPTPSASSMFPPMGGRTTNQAFAPSQVFNPPPGLPQTGGMSMGQQQESATVQRSFGLQEQPLQRIYQGTVRLRPPPACCCLDAFSSLDPAGEWKEVLCVGVGVGLGKE
jgi:hypothetical protein